MVISPVMDGGCGLLRGLDEPPLLKRAELLYLLGEQICHQWAQNRDKSINSDEMSIPRSRYIRTAGLGEGA